MNNTEYDLLTREDFAMMLEAAEQEIVRLEKRVSKLEIEVEYLRDELDDLMYPGADE